MQVLFTFRHVDTSEALKEYTQEQLERVGRFLLKQSRWQVVYSMGRFECKTEIMVRGPWGTFKATAESDDFYRSVDEAASKLERQFQKRKQQLQHHKVPEKSREGRMSRLNESLEYDNRPFLRKSA